MRANQIRTLGQASREHSKRVVAENSFFQLKNDSNVQQYNQRMHQIAHNNPQGTRSNSHVSLSIRNNLNKSHTSQSSQGRLSEQDVVTPTFRMCSPRPTRISVRGIMKSAPHMVEGKMGSMTGHRGFSHYQQQVGSHTQVRQKESESEPLTTEQQNKNEGNKSQKQVKQDLKLRTKYQLRFKSQFQQNQFEVESASASSSDEQEVNEPYASNQFESDISRQKTEDESIQFINIYQREYGMPESLENETDVKDYILKLLEYKSSSDEFSGEDIQVKRTNSLQQEIENDLRSSDKTQTLKGKPSGTSLTFKKVSNKEGFLILKRNEAVYKVVFVRHGQSIWNKDGRCSGWVDVPLNDKGRNEAHEAGQLLNQLGYKFDLAYTSFLSRAFETNNAILEELGQKNQVELIRAWQLNERHYGALEGRVKTELEKQYGTKQVKLWRQSYDNPPPSISYEHKLHPRFDELYCHLPEEEKRKLPTGESLEMVLQRVEPYWQEKIVPHLQSLGPNKQMLFTAHQHVCRGVVKVLTGIDNEAVMGLRIPNAAPFVFEFDQNMKPLRNYYADNEDVEVAQSQKLESKETLFMHGR